MEGTGVSYCHCFCCRDTIIDPPMKMHHEQLLQLRPKSIPGSLSQDTDDDDDDNLLSDEIFLPLWRDDPIDEGNTCVMVS